MDALQGRWLSVLRNKLDGDCTRMLRAVLNKSWKQLPTKQQLYGYLTSISKINQIRGTRHAGHYWRSKNEPISNILQWTPSHLYVSDGRQTRTYLQQLYTNTGWMIEDLPGAMDDWHELREREREREKEFRARRATLMMIMICNKWRQNANKRSCIKRSQ